MVTKLIHKFYGDELGKAYDNFLYSNAPYILNEHKFEKFAENHKEEIDQTLPYFKEKLMNGPIWLDEEVKEWFARASYEEKFNDLVWYFFEDYYKHTLKNIYNFKAGVMEATNE